MSEYIEPGLATLEYRNFAFQGNDSVRAAEAAECALDQGRFWDYHETLFYNQPSGGVRSYTDPRLRGIAEQLHLDLDAFTACFDGQRHQALIADEADQARADGVTATPWVTVNGTQITYTGNWPDLKAQIDAELERVAVGPINTQRSMMIAVTSVTPMARMEDAG